MKIFGEILVGCHSLLIFSSKKIPVSRTHRAVADLLADMTSNNQVIGLGTGVAVNAYIRELSRRLEDGRLTVTNNSSLKFQRRFQFVVLLISLIFISIVQGVRCVPSSDVTASEAAFHGVPLTSLDDIPGVDANASVDLMIDVADELDTTTLAYIVGRGENGPQAGQPSLPRLRQMSAASQVRVVVVDGPECCCEGAAGMGGSVPVLIEGNESTWEDVAEELDDIFLGDAEIRRRSTKVEADPRGGGAPVLTPDGHMVIDVQFYDGLALFGERVSVDRIVEEIESVPGVVTHGLMVGARAAATIAVVGGSVPPLVFAASVSVGDSLPQETNIE